MVTFGVIPVQLMELNWIVSTSDPQLFVAVMVMLLLPLIGVNPNSNAPEVGLKVKDDCSIPLTSTLMFCLLVIFVTTDFKRIAVLEVML